MKKRVGGNKMNNIIEKSKYILAGLFCLGMFISVKAQDSTATAKLDEETGENVTIFNTPVKTTRDVGCSLVQNSDHKVTTFRGGYKIVTGDEDEVITVRNKHNGDKKIRYYNGYEDLKYTLSNNGEEYYKYSYYNECKKVKVRKNKKGDTHVVNNSKEINDEEAKGNVLNAINKGANSCMSNKYSE